MRGSIEDARRKNGLWSALALTVYLCSACASWKPRAEYEGWTLYAQDSLPVDPAEFQHAFDPAMIVVQRELGPFERSVRVYAWDEGTRSIEPGTEQIQDAGEGLLHEVPGIGPARVRAFHARDDGFFGPPSGVFVGKPEAGTAAHELVHARLAEDARTYPLWLEEGLACVIGDGFLARDGWVIDGLACWPLAQLRQQSIDDDEFDFLLGLHAEDVSSVRDNVLVHFVGWAIVFDLYRETGGIDWPAWRARYRQGITIQEARERLQRSISEETVLAWLDRLGDPDPNVRLATAKGVWKLRSTAIVQRLLDRLEKESVPEVRVGLAINALAAAGEQRLPPHVAGRMWRMTWPVLRRETLEVAEEQAALTALFRSIRVRTNRPPQDELEALRRFWAE
ncbi:MAG: HEAT repeat domain-containing protein [Planctomycetota bacterium]